MPRVLEFTVPPNTREKRCVSFYETAPRVSARLLRALKTQPNGIRRNGNSVRTVDLLHTGDLLQLTLPDETEHGTRVLLPLPLDVLYEDDDLLVVNKPAGLAMHETHNHQGDALSNAVGVLFAAARQSRRVPVPSGGLTRALPARSFAH